MDISRRDLFKVGGKLLVLASVGATLEQITGAERRPAKPTKWPTTGGA